MSLFQVPDPVALFPLNAQYGTREINDRVTRGVPTGVSLAQGPDGQADGSYEFFGTANSYIRIPNSENGPLDARYSITMLCWVYSEAQEGPLFNYRQRGAWGVHLWVGSNSRLFVRFTIRDYSFTEGLLSDLAIASGVWKFVGASYDGASGYAKLWIDGNVVQTLHIGAGLDLATQDPIRMGVKEGDGRYFRGRIAQMQVYNVALTQEQIQVIQQRTQVVSVRMPFMLLGTKNSLNHNQTFEKSFCFG